MFISASGRGKGSLLWSADWFVGVLVVLTVFLSHSFTDFFGTLERRYYDFASTSTSRQSSERIAIIAIDDQSIANIGRWPRPRDVQANLINQLAAAKAQTVVNTTLFFEAPTDWGMALARKIKDLTVDSAPTLGASDEQIDTDTKLATSMSNAANDFTGFNATVVQSVTVYREIQTIYAETSAFYKTTVSYIRGTATKI